LLGEYADLLLRTNPYVGEYVCRSTGIRSSRLRLYPEQFLRIRIVCPPVNEQKAILARLASEIRDRQEAIAGAQREISLLLEYRTRLISDVVTGKLDVREVAARLPDEADDAVPLNELDTFVDGDEDATDDPGDTPEEAEV
jgi:type I restriction enzyme S subunit